MNVMEKILNDMKLQGQLAFEQGIDSSRLSDEETKSMKEEISKGLMKQFDISKEIADKQASTAMDANKEAGEKAQWQKMLATENVSRLDELKGAFQSSMGNLGSALQDDFKQITGGLSLIAEAPGMKSIIAIITTMSSLLGTLVLSTLKKNLSENSFIGKRISMKEGGGVDFTKTLKNFNPFTKFKDEDKTEGGGTGKLFKNKNPDGSDKSVVGKPAVKDTFLQKSNKKFTKSLRSLRNGITSITNSFMSMGWVTKVTTLLSAAGTSLMIGLTSLGTTLAVAGTSLMVAAKTIGTATATLVTSMLSTAGSILLAGLTMLAPVIIIGLAIAALIFGLLYLRDKFIENKDMIMAKWAQISEGFKIALGGLVLWKDKAVAFIGNTFKSIWLSIKGFFVTVMEGIENGINYAIAGINKMIPGERYDLSPVDLGAGDMRAEFEKEQGAFEIEKKSQGEEFERRQQDLLDRKSANTTGGSSSVVQQNNVVNEGDRSTQIVPTGTNPVDVLTANLALAQ